MFSPTTVHYSDRTLPTSSGPAVTHFRDEVEDGTRCFVARTSSPLDVCALDGMGPEAPAAKVREMHDLKGIDGVFERGCAAIGEG